MTPSHKKKPRPPAKNPRPGADNPAAAFRPPAWVFPAALMLIGALIYANTVHSPFLLDDNVFIVSDTAVHMTALNEKNLEKAAFEGQPRHRYLPNISFALNYYFGGLNPLGYHLVNIAIHLLAGIFLFLCIKNTLIIHAPLPQTKKGPPVPYSPDADPAVIAFFAALLWIVQPVNTQAVTYICQRMASMVAMFYILSLFLYVKARMSMKTPGAGAMASAALYFAGCGLAGICAVAAKENAGTLPLVIILYEWFFFQDLKLFQNRKQWLLTVGAVIFFILITALYLGTNPITSIMAGYAHRDFTLPQRVMTEFRVIIYYISLFFWPSPSRLNLDHDYPLSFSLIDPWTTLLCLIAIIALAGAAIAAAKKDRLISFCILWFLINLLIESSVIGIEIIFEHRAYLPFMMVSLLFTLLVIRRAPRPIAFLILSSAVALFAIWTYQRNNIWKDELAFYEDCAIKSPKKARPLQNLATALQLHGKTPEAESFFLKALEIDPENINSYNNLANICAERHDIGKAFDYYTKALSIDPHSTGYKSAEAASAHFNMGSILLGRGMTEEAIFHFTQGLNLYPDNAEAQNRMGMALMKLGKLDEAKDHFMRALQIDPGNTGALKNLNDVTTALQNTPEPAKNPPPAILYPENAPLNLILAVFYQRQKEFPMAITQYQKTLLINPSDARALLGLGECFKAIGETSKSILVYQRLIELEPENAMLYYRIACVYAGAGDKSKAEMFLQQAVKKGLNVAEKLKTNPDFTKNPMPFP
ncbi:MAG: tetratricopeptide repeat protein [Desulfobacteraceae bacterium]|nr:tetratricopeptide repeat protein [Desulfobacteraceae bacterium]